MSVCPVVVIILLTYILNALLSFIAFATPFTKRFGITLVYKLPGPITIASASSIASITPGATLQFVGLINIRLILLVFEFTISGILSLLSITVPSSSSAHIFIGSNVTGNTLPVIFNTFRVCSIDLAKSPHNSFIPNKYISPKDKFFNLPFENCIFISFSIVFSSFDNATKLSFISSNGIVSSVLLDSGIISP